MLYSIVDVLLGGRRGAAATRVEGRPYTTIERTLVTRMIVVVVNDARQAFAPTAPWSGTILAVDVTVGAVIGAGTPVVTLLDTANIQFHTSNLSERDLAQVELGQTVEMTLKSYPATPLAGTVVGIAPQSSGVVGDAAVFTVMIDLAETELVLRPGMSGRAQITDES